MPATAVIPAPVAYERPVKAEKLVVGSACGKYGSHSVSRVPVRNPHYHHLKLFQPKVACGPPNRAPRATGEPPLRKVGCSEYELLPLALPSALHGRYHLSPQRSLDPLIFFPRRVYSLPLTTPSSPASFNGWVWRAVGHAVPGSGADIHSTSVV